MQTEEFPRQNIGDGDGFFDHHDAPVFVFVAISHESFVGVFGIDAEGIETGVEMFVEKWALDEWDKRRTIVEIQDISAPRGSREVVDADAIESVGCRDFVDEFCLITWR